jgi:hypothetical protein
MIDILLHESGHIMLSDFDLAKQSQEPGGLPAAVIQFEDGVRLHFLFQNRVYIDSVVPDDYSLSDLGTHCRYKVVHCGSAGKLVCWNRG